MTDPVTLIVSALIATTAVVMKSVLPGQGGTRSGSDILDCIGNLSGNVFANCLHEIRGTSPRLEKIAEGTDFIRVQRVALRACVALVPAPERATLVARWRWRWAARKLAKYAAQAWPSFDEYQQHWAIVRAKDPMALLRDFEADRERSRAATIAAWECFIGAAGSRVTTPDGLRRRAAENIWQQFPQQFFNALAYDQPAHNKAMSLGQAMLQATVMELPKKITAVHGPKLRNAPQQPDIVRSGAKTDRVSIFDLHYTERWLPDLLFREPEIAELTSFLLRPEPYLWWGVIGEGGVGKSRIGLEIVAIARAAGWDAGFLDRIGDEEVCSFPERLDLWEPVGNTLVVVDYASFHRKELPRALRLFAEVRPRFGGHLRVLLLDRPGSLASVFSEAGELGVGAEGRANAAALRFCARMSRETEPDAPFDETRDLLTLGSLTQAHWAPFLRTVVERAGHAGFEIDDTPPALEGIAQVTGGGRPLLLTIYGLALVRPGTDASTRLSMDAMLDEALREEVIHRWNSLLWRRTGVTKPHPLLRAFQRAVAFITLCRGFIVKENIVTLRTAAGTKESDDKSLYVALRRLLVRPLSPGRKGELPPLEPDLLAERFLLAGGITFSSPDALDDTSLPFTMEDFFPLVADHAPMGLAEMLFVTLRDYGEGALPLFIAAIPHLSLTGITRDGATASELLPPQEVSHPVLSIWQMVGVAALFPEGTDPYGIATPLREWGMRSLAHRYASFLGLLKLAEKGQQGYLLAYLVAYDFIPPHAELPPAFAQLVAAGAVYAVRAFAKHEAWPEVRDWADELCGVASAHRANEEVQTWLARGAAILISVYRDEGERPKMEEWEKELLGVALAHPANKEIQTLLANGAVLAISNYVAASEWARVEEWARVLRAAMPDQLTRTDDIQTWQRIYRLLNDISDETPHVVIARVITEISERFWERDFGENGAPLQILTNAVRLVAMFDTSSPEVQRQLEQLVESGGFSMDQLRMIAKAGEQS